MSKRDTKIVFVSEAWDSYSPPRRIKYYAVQDKATGHFLFGPATWKACCAWKQGRPPWAGE